MCFSITRHSLVSRGMRLLLFSSQSRWSSHDGYVTEETTKLHRTIAHWLLTWIFLRLDSSYPLQVTLTHQLYRFQARFFTRQKYHLSLHHECFAMKYIVCKSHQVRRFITRFDFVRWSRSLGSTSTILRPEIPSRRLPQLIPQLEEHAIYMREPGLTFPGSASCCTPVAPPWRRHPPDGGSLTYRIRSVETMRRQRAARTGSLRAWSAGRLAKGSLLLTLSLSFPLSWQRRGRSCVR